MADDGTIWKQSIAGVISSLIVLSIGWAAGLLPIVWRWALDLLGSIWSLVTFSIRIPLWLILLALVSLIVWRLKWKVARGVAQAAQASTDDQPTEDLLRERDLAVVAALAAADGRWLTIETMATKLGTANLLVEESIDQLFSMGLLLDSHNYLHGTSYRLSSSGRDLAIQYGYVRGR